MLSLSHRSAMLSQGPLPPAIPVLQAPQGDSDIQWQRTPIPTQAPPAAPGLSTHIPLHTSALVQKMATKQHRQLPTAFQRVWETLVLWRAHQEGFVH